MRKILLMILPALLFANAALGEQKPPPPAPKGTRSTVVREAPIYVAPDTGSDKIGRMMPGREMVIVEKSGTWLRVFANTDSEEAQEEDAPVFGQDTTPTPVSGWVTDRGVVTADTPSGDIILMGEAASKEIQASQPHMPLRVALEARLLYRRLSDLFPQSTFAPEAAWRAADIRWQLQKSDAMSRPSALEKESYLREQMNDDEVKKIEKKYPHTKWSDMAAFLQIDNKLCGDWQGSTKCPEKESDLYEKYVSEHPDSPRAPEALYSAVYRQCALVDMYTADEEKKKSDGARGKAKELEGKLVSHWPQTDYAARAAALIYKMEQNIPIYGVDRE